MSKTFKKLLSLLVAIALVIAMTPVSSLEVLAADDSSSESTTTTNPGAAQAAAGAAIEEAAEAITFPTDGSNYDAYCPHCEKTVTWEAKKVSTSGGALSWGSTNEDETGNHHIYVAGFTPTADAPCTSGNFLTTNATNYDSLCIHLNGYDLYTVGRIFINRPITVSIMGEGSINKVGELYGTDTEDPVSSGMSLLDVSAAATLNLYGGTYTSNLGAVQDYYSSNSYHGTIRMTSSGTVVNMYEDVKLQPTSGTAVGMYRGTFNMYGGEISGGTGYPLHSGTAGSIAGGNVYMNGKAAAGTTDCVFNQYGGTISGGDVTAYAGNGGGNIYVCYATFNCYSTISGGKANATKGFGGNVYGYSGAVLNLESGAQVLGTYTGASTDVVGAAYGGNIGSGGAFTVNLKPGAKVSNGYSTVRAGNIDFSGNGILNMTGGELTGGHGKTGGNLFAHNDTADINISGGTISGGVASTYGGNIYVTKSEVDIYGDALITGGNSTSGGGNIFFKGESTGTGTLSIYGSAQITEGETSATANGGGNIMINGTADYATCVISENAQITGGECTASGAYGGNIYCTAADLTISGGTISGGSTVSWQTTSNVYKTGDTGTLTISGGSIAGDVCPYKGEAFVISGAPTITESTKGNGVNMSNLTAIQMTLGEMTEGASVCVTYPLDGTVFSVENTNAASYVDAGYFTSKSGYEVVCDDAGCLYIQEAAEEELVKGDFDDNLTFASDGSTAWCPACNDYVTWTELTAAVEMTDGCHYYVGSGKTVDIGSNHITSTHVSDDDTYCLNLNGGTITGSSYMFFPNQGALNVMGQGTVTSSNATGAQGGVFHLNAGYGNGATVNIYGGNYTVTGKSTVIFCALGVVNIHGGTITGADSETYATVYIPQRAAKAATVNMYGGSITGGDAVPAVHVKNSSEETDNAHFNLSAGTVTGGTISGNGASIKVDAGGAFTMSGGTVTGGTAASGGNIYASSAASVALNGGEITEGTATSHGGNVYIDSSDLTIAGTKITGGEAARYGGNVYLYGTEDGTVTATMTSGTVSGGTASTGDNYTASYGGGNITLANAYVTFNLQGGDITGGTAHTGGSIRNNGGTLNISGGTVTGGTSANKIHSNIHATGTGTLNISGGSIAGGIYAYNLATLSVSGAPTITAVDNNGLYVNTALTQLTLGTLTEGASICVTFPLDGTVFSVANTNAESYAEAGYITTLSGYEVLCDDAGGLYISKAEIEYVKGTFTDGIELIDGKGYCPACDDIVDWVELNTFNEGRIGYVNFNIAYADGSTDKTLYEAGTPTCYHYYLSADLSFKDKAQYAERYYSNVCINLNGHDLSFTGRMTFGTGCNLTIMGPAGSVVTSTGTYTKDGEHTEMICVQGECDIYAGTYKCSNTSWPILAAKWASAKVNLYEGVTFDGENIERNTALIALVGATTVDIEGATIQGGNNTTAALANNDGTSGYAYGGGDLIMGGNVAVWNGGTLNVNSGTITGGKCAGQGGNIYVFKGTVNVAAGATVTLGEAGTNGGNISLDYGGATLTTAGNITDGKATGTVSFGGNISSTSAAVVNITGGEISGGQSLNSQGGNIRVYGAATASTLNISGGEIKGGDAGGTNTNDNVWAAGNVIINFTGGTVYATEGGANNSGIAASAATDSNGIGYGVQLYMSGSASVVNNEETGNVQITTTTYDSDSDGVKDATAYSKLYILDGWSGKASVKWPTAYTSGTIDTTVGQAGTVTDGVFYAGDIDTTGTLLCAPNSLNVFSDAEGTLYLATLMGVKADGTEEGASDLTGDYAYFKLLSSQSLELPAGDYYIDLNGYTLTTTGEGTLYGMDSTATVTTEGTAAASVASGLEVDVTNPVTGVRYIAITQSGVTTFHVLEMAITTVSLRPSVGGMYYKASYKCDQTLVGAVEGYGVVYSLVDMPGVPNEATDMYTSFAKETFTGNGTATSSMVTNIVSENYSNENNAAYGEMPIYANAYVALCTNDSTENYSVDILVADNDNVGKKTTNDDGSVNTEFTGVAYSLKMVLDAIDADAKWSTLTTAQQDSVNEFYTAWYDKGLSAWTFKNITKVEEA